MNIFEITKKENVNKKYTTIYEGKRLLVKVVQCYGDNYEVVRIIKENGDESMIRELSEFIYTSKLINLNFEEYKEVEYFGDLNGCIDELLKYKAKGEMVSINFNGHILYSDTITVDGAYQEVLGDTKAEWEERCERERLRYEKHKREHEASIPNKTKYWRDKARRIIREDKLDYWDEIVPIRLKDLYEGMELECCIELAKLTKDNLFEEAKEKLSNQGHSGMSYGLVCSMIREFAENGEDFLKYIKVI